MNRSMIMYPLARGADRDSGADLQTDVMRFMAILSLCLVAIFALVQSMPVAPRPAEPAPPATPAAPAEVPDPPPRQSAPDTRSASPSAGETAVTLARPAQVAPRTAAVVPPAAMSVLAVPAAALQDPEKGFTLRFESDIALTRLVAANKVGFFAIVPGRARRMAVSDSRLSFWDASMPGSFHEMEASTVPAPVVDALLRTGAETGTVKWGVTLPAKLSARLATIMREETGGAIVIRGDGDLALDAS